MDVGFQNRFCPVLEAVLWFLAPKMEKYRKNRKNRIREVLFHVPKLYWDCIMVFGKRSSRLRGSQWAADSAALPLDVDMAGDVRG